MQVPSLTKGHKGLFTPRFPEKYRGRVHHIIWRSTWEKHVMDMLDTNKNVLEWSSEELVIPYFSPVDGRWHRYFPDFKAKVRKPDGRIHVQVIEVKPFAQTMMPNLKRKKTKKLLVEMATWAINDAKWKAAREYCADRGWEFLLLTERDLGI